MLVQQLFVNELGYDEHSAGTNKIVQAVPCNIV